MAFPTAQVIPQYWNMLKSLIWSPKQIVSSFFILRYSLSLLIAFPFELLFFIISTQKKLSSFLGFFTRFEELFSMLYFFVFIIFSINLLIDSYSLWYANICTISSGLFFNSSRLLLSFLSSTGTNLLWYLVVIAFNLQFIWNSVA